MLQKKVSVVIPTYRRSHMIVRAIESVLLQDYTNIEIIVVDDNGIGSFEHDETKLAVAKYCDKIKYISHEENKGGSAARNTGFFSCTGDYVTFLDDDDTIKPSKIRKQVLRLESLDDSYGACYTDYEVIYPNSTSYSSTKEEGDVYLQALARTFYVGSGSNLLVKTKFVKEINGYDTSFKRNQDIEFMVRLFEKCKVCRVKENLLSVHWEERQFKRTYEFIESITTFYLDKMSSRINSLESKDKRKVLDIINLESSRVALGYKEYRKFLKYFRKAKFTRRIKYIYYILNRVLRHKSYGFKG